MIRHCVGQPGQVGTPAEGDRGEDAGQLGQGVLDIIGGRLRRHGQGPCRSHEALLVTGG
jgi:hypothetical protein